MWIKTTIGKYINTDNVYCFYLMELKSGDWAVVTSSGVDGHYETIAILGNREDAQKLLDKLMKKVGQILVVDMAEWNYTGHKKGHKETRHGGS